MAPSPRFPFPFAFGPGPMRDPFPIAAPGRLLPRNDDALPLHAGVHSHEPSGYRRCGRHGAAPVADGRHGEDPFFEVLAVPIVV